MQKLDIKYNFSSCLETISLKCSIPLQNLHNENMQNAMYLEYEMVTNF